MNGIRQFSVCSNDADLLDGYFTGEYIKKKRNK
jgi:hypothetical protein